MKNKRLYTLFIIALTVAMLSAFVLSACNSNSGGSIGGKKETLVIYNWEDYIDESEGTSRLEAFKQYYKNVTGNDVDIVYTTFDTNETMLTKVLNDDANSVDLICPSEYAIQKLMANDRLSSLSDLIALYDNSTLPNGNVLSLDNLHTTMQNTEPSFVSAIENEFCGDSAISIGNGKTGDMTDYMVPYMMGTLGIMYNANVLTEDDLANGWGLLWNIGQNSTLENKILVKDSVRDTYVAAVMYLRQYNLLPDGYADKPVAELINCTDDALLAAAEKVLTEQREHIAGYEVDFGKDDMLNQIVYVDLAWSGDALWAIEESYDEESDTYMLDYFVPEDEDGNPTGNIWFDGWVVPKSAPNKLAAVMFVDFMNDPDNAIYNSIYIGYTSAVARERMMYEFDSDGVVMDGENKVVNEEVYSALVDSEYALALDDEDNNPDGEYDFSYFEDERRYPVKTAKLGVMRDFAERNQTVITMWENAKTGKDVPWALIWASIAIVGFAGAVALFAAVKNKIKLRPKKIKAE